MTLEIRDQCPNCLTDLGRQAYEEKKNAGDVVTCERCGVTFDIAVLNDGWQEYFVFTNPADALG